ncbi:MAG: VWA domain-containing protein [Acidobacteriota bacterium]|nr:VWA domain-containing protein [Acidobacteriota bacterium]
MSRRPGGELASRPLHFIWIADASGSMQQDGKIQALNNAIREAVPHMRKVADDNPNAQVLVRAVKFSDGAQWHISQPTPVADFAWNDIPAEGETDMGKALSLVAEQLKMPPMSDRALPPVLVLISDGQPTDDFEKGLKDLLDQPWGKKAVRIAIAIGQDADAETLQKFIAHPEMKPLAANSPEALVKHIKWASTAVLKSASSPAAGGTDHPDASPAAAGTPVGVPVPSAQPAVADPSTAASTPGGQATGTPSAIANAPDNDPASNQKSIDDVW